MNRTLVISIDAMITSDIPVLQTLPNLGRVMAGASWVTDIECVYPTLTYPCHATIATGCYPNRHGISNNEKTDFFAPRADWYWYRQNIKVPTLIDYAKSAGLTTATVTWPVMGASGADWNIAEVWAPSEADDPTPYFVPANSPAAAPVFEVNKHMLRWMKTPQMDEFASKCAVDIIRAHRPDLMLLHLSYVDHQRHRHGVHSPEIANAFHFIDRQLGMVLDAVEETSGLENTNVVLLGDHGQLYCDEMFHLNTLFRQLAWVDVENGAMTDYRVYAASCSLSAHIYLKPGMDTSLVYKILLEQQAKYPKYLERIFTKEEATAMHLTGDFDFVIEAGDRVCFGRGVGEEQLITPINELSEHKPSVSNHGHLPQKGDKPPFIVSGPDARQGVLIHGGRLVDEAPTILGLLHIPVAPGAMDGVALDLLVR